MSDSVRPQRQQRSRLPRPWDSPGKNTGVGCHFFLQSMKVKSENEVAQSCRLLVTPWTAAYQAPPSMGLSRQEYWSGVPLPSPFIMLLDFKEKHALQGLSSFAGKILSSRPFHFHALEKEMATHSSVLAWRIPGMGSLLRCCLWGRTESDTTEAT